MGKTRRSKTKAKPDNPTGLPSIRDIVLEEELLGVDEVGCRSLQAVIEQIQATNVEDKLCGLQTLASLFQKPESVEEALSAGVVRIAGPLLVDTNADIRNAAAGALRNLSLTGVDACDTLVEQDVLTPLFALLQLYSGEWNPFALTSKDNKQNAEITEIGDTFLQAVHLVWNLCESSPRALEILTKSLSIPILAKCLDVKQYGYDIAIGVAQCLQVVTEDNPDATDILLPYEDILNNLLQLNGDESNVLLLRTVVAGIFINLESLSSLRQGLIFTTLQKTLTPDHRNFLNTISSALPLGEDVDEKSFSADLEKQIQQVEYLIEAQKTALELLTNICSAEDTEEFDTMECDESDNDSDYEDIDCDSGNGTPLALDKIPVELLEAVGSLGIVEKVWGCAQPLAENVDHILNEHEPGQNLLKKVTSLRSSALLCLHNLSSSLPLEMLGGAEALRSVWLQVGHQVFRGKPGDEALLESATALMRAALERLRRQGPPNLFAEISENDIQLMLEGEKHCIDSEVRANWLRMLGLLGPLLSESLAQRIAVFLLEVCGHETQLWPLAEALDALIDMFSEDDTDILASKIHLIEKLTPLVPVLKNKMRQQKRTLGERAVSVGTVVSNLPRFIKYKKNRLSTSNGKA